MIDLRAQKISTNLSLIIASLNEGKELHETLKSIFAGSLLPNEVIVIDDGGTDGSCSVLEQDEWRSRRVRVHRIERCGIAAARNTGSRLATGTSFAFLDAHCRLEFNCLAAMQAAHSAQPNAIIAPSVCDYHSNVFGCGARLIDAELRYRWLPPPLANGDYHNVPIAPGGCLVLSKKTFDRLGGFGAFRELGLEDVEFGLRAWRAGIDILAVPSAKLAHQFRNYPTYSLTSTSRAYNLARVALVHFDGCRREECLRKIIGTPRSAEVLVDAFTSDWEDQRYAIAVMSKRAIEAFFEIYGDWR